MIGLIDGDILPYSVSYYAEKEGITDEKEIEGRVDSLLFSNILECNLDSYLIFLSGKNNFRKSIYKYYKANRPKDKPRHYKYIREYLIKEYSAFIINGAEADDALAICHTHFKDSVIISRDKDFHQVTGLHFNPFEGNLFRITDETAWEKLWLQVITGDVVDNIKGLKGYGKVKAKKVLDYDNPEEFPQQVYDEFVKNDQESDFFLTFRLVFLIRNNKRFEIPNPISIKNIMKKYRNEDNYI